MQRPARPGARIPDRDPLYTPSPSMGEYLRSSPSPSMGEGRGGGDCFDRGGGDRSTSGGGDAEDRSMVKKMPSAGPGEGTRNPHRGGSPKAATTDPADPAQLIADLQRQLAECRAERDAGLAREAALAEVLQTTNSSPGDLTPVFDAILEKAHALCGVEHGALVTYDGEYFRVAADRGMPQFFTKQLRQPFRASPGSPHERLLRGERYTQVADAQAAADAGPQRRLAVRTGSRTILVVPLRKQGALF